MSRPAPPHLGKRRQGVFESRRPRPLAHEVDGRCKHQARAVVRFTTKMATRRWCTP